MYNVYIYLVYCTLPHNVKLDYRTEKINLVMVNSSIVSIVGVTNISVL